MPTSSSTYHSVPVNRNARRRIMRTARLGARPAPSAPNVGDAVRAIDSVRAIVSGWDASTDPLPTTVRTAWAAREA